MKRISWNEDWTFVEDGKDAVAVRLPHDAMLQGGRDKDSASGSAAAWFRGGKYIYTKKFTAPADWKEQSVSLVFEGVYPSAEVLLNDKIIGCCNYGYLGYGMPLDDLKYGEENTVTVQVDNTETPNSRWYSGAGIYRPVWLVTGSRTHIKHGFPKVTTLDYKEGKIGVETETETTGNEPDTLDGVSSAVTGVKLDIKVEILDKEGTVVAQGEGNCLELKVPQHRLWSDTTPYLYTCRVKLLKDGAVVDEADTRFGIREISWSAEGLFINGVQTLLKGGCLHHDNGVIGARTFRESEYRKIKRMKEFGFNAIRSSHNPAGAALLEACDELGMYVLDEGWDMWYSSKTRYDYSGKFMEQYPKDIEGIVEQDYNHPSVIMYSIGNEVTEPAKPEGVEMAKKLVDAFHALDSTRPVTCGINIALLFMATMGINLTSDDGQGEAAAKAMQQEEEEKVTSTTFNRMVYERADKMKYAALRDEIEAVAVPVFDVLDIAGYNYASPRYDVEGEKHPGRIVLGTETYPYELASSWEKVEKYPYLLGDFMWTAWDYIGETGIGAWIYDADDIGFQKEYPWLLADTGAFDILGNDNAEAGMAAIVWDARNTPYIGVRPANRNQQNLVKAMWRGSNAMPHWSYQGCDGNMTVVEVYSKAHSVELFINDRSVGKKEMTECKAEFEVAYESGELRAVCYTADGMKAGESSLRSAAKDVSLSVCAAEKLTDDEIIYVDISVRDGDGVVECNADRKVRVSVEGGELLGFGSANPKTEEDFTAGEYKTYYGRSLAVIRKVGKQAMITVEDCENGTKYQTGI